MDGLKFKKLTLADKQILEDFAKDYLPFSDFSFLSLFTYNTSGTLEYCFYNGNLVIKFEDYLTGENFYSLLGDSKLHETIERLLECAKDAGLKYSLHLIPHSVIELSPGLHERFSVEEDRDNFDYIVSSLDIAKLHSKKLPKKKKIVDEFKKKYPHLTAKPIDLSSSSNKQAIMDTFDLWGEIGHKEKGELNIERQAVKRLLENAHHFPDLYALGIYDGDKLVAFNTYEVSTHSHGISSFQKADRRYEGVYAFLTHEMAKSMVALGCKYINFEQDLGIDGLRASKQSWHPVTFLKKYTISSK